MSDPEDTTGGHFINVEAIAGTSKAVTATLILLSGSNAIGKVYRLDRASMTIGRSLDADICLDHESVSRQHARVVQSPNNEVRLIDMGSKHGTFCNGIRVDTVNLKEGDKIHFGNSTVVKFTYQDKLDEALQRNLYESATKDNLTGVYNRKFFNESLNKEFAFCLRHNVPLTLLMVDIDHFKQVNDTYGHPAGDLVLKQVAAKLNETIRTEDLFARYGGEEFVVLLRECTEEGALIVARRLRDLIEALPIQISQKELKVTVSIGGATLKDRSYLDHESLVMAADRYLYRAKQGGRNRVESRGISGP